MEPLATQYDLADRGICVPGSMNDSAALDSASAAVRDAAGCAISQLTSTVVLIADQYRVIELPAGPVESVASVVVDGEPVTGWSKVGDNLLMPHGWASCLPAEVTVTYTHGYPVVPADIVDLVCGMVAIAFGQDGEYGSSGRLASVRLGEFAESYSTVPGSDSPSPMSVPDGVRQRLRARFGASVAAIGQR